MDKRQQELIELREYIENIDKETTLLLQNFQWDPKHIIESTVMVSCNHDTNHRIPLATKEAHQKQCYITQQGYCKREVLLPDPVDPDANTVVKLSKQDIKHIIDMASSTNPGFKRGVGSPGAEPLTVERLQHAYTADERRAIHDAVVNAAPFCHDLTDLALASSSDEPRVGKVKSRGEILAELRDMKRRRTKYRVAAKTRNYSHMLRDVIKTQMELYAEATGTFIKTEYGSKTYETLDQTSESISGEKVPSNIDAKQERMSPETGRYSVSSSRYRKRSGSRDRKYDSDRRRHGKKIRDNYDIRDNSSTHRKKHNDFSQERHKYDSKERRYHKEHSKHDEYYKTKEDDGLEDGQNTTKKKYRPTHDVSKESNEYGSNLKTHNKYSRNSEKDVCKDKNKYDAGASYRDHRKYDRRKERSSSVSSKYSDYHRKHKKRKYEEVDTTNYTRNEVRDIDDDSDMVKSNSSSKKKKYETSIRKHDYDY